VTKPEIVGLMERCFGGATDPCQTHRGDEFPERPGCANKRMGLETDGKPFLNGGFSRFVRSDGFLTLRTFNSRNDDCFKQAFSNLPRRDCPLSCETLALQQAQKWLPGTDSAER
jgi:hypothetical protein